MSVIDKIKFDGTTYDVGKTPDTTLAVSGSPADAATVGTELDKKVDKVTGKGLSTEDFTTAEKTKLTGIAEGATNVVIDPTLTQAGQAADAKETGDGLTDLKADLSFVENVINTNPETYTASNNYYMLISQLKAGTTYKIGISVATSGSYAVQTGTANNASSLVSTLFDVTPFTANVMQYVYYTPSGDGEKYLRLTSNSVSWSASISEFVNSEELSNEVATLNDCLFETSNVQIIWEHGTIDLSGADSASNTRVRTIGVRTIEMNETITAESGFKYVFRFYKTDGTFAGYSAWLTGTNSVNDEAALVTGATKYRLIGAYSSDESTVSEEALAAVANAITVVYKANKIDRLEDTLNETIEVTTPLNWKIGSIGANNGEDGVSTTRIRTFGYIEYVQDDVIKNSSSTSRYALRIYSNDKSYLGYSPWYTTAKTLSSIIEECTFVNAGTVGYYRITASYTNDSAITDISAFGATIALIEGKNLQEIYTLQMRNPEISIHKSATGNCTIRAAKEQAYVDGTPPVIEWYLLEEPQSGRFYYSADLQNKQYMFTFPYETSEYSFGILQNGDVIVCLDADSIPTQNKSDSNRVNPFVFLAAENWSVLHEVDFGSNLKPCGWVMDVGFKVLADGSAIFCEYTRQTTYTANIWKISGDPTDASNWTVTKSFVVTSTDNSTGFKHCHMVSQDHYTGVCYMSTGDDNEGSMLFCSTDNGSTWTQLVSPDSDGQTNEYGWITGSEKYCRALNFIYTEDYIYWASDTNNLSIHYLFRVGRDANGVFDFGSVVDLLQIPENSGASTYGLVYLPQYNAIFMLDRTDRDATTMDLRMVMLDDNSIITVGKMEAIASNLPNGSRLGFRYRFATKYSKDGVINIGFGLRGNNYDNYINHNKGFGNTGTWKDGSGIYNINNMVLRITPTPTTYALTIDTRYI